MSGSNLVSVWPVQVRSIAGDVSTRVLSRGGAPSGSWFLHIAGPFSVWPSRDMRAWDRIASSLSNRLALPVSFVRKNVGGNTYCEIKVQIPQSYLDRVIAKVYQKETAA